MRPGLPLRATVLLFALDLAACRTGPRDLAAARLLLEGGRPAEACGIFEELAHGGLGTRAERLEIARSFVDGAARAGGLARVQSWLDTSPEEPVALYTRALLEVARSPSGLSRALDLLRRSAGLWPREGEIPFRAGLLLLADERAAEALPELTRACRLNDTATCAVTLAHALLDLGRVEAALQQARRVIRLDPRPADLARGRVLIHRVARRSRRIPEGALPRYREALSLLGRDAEGAGIEGARAAARVLELLVAEHPRLAAAHTLLGLTRLRLEQNAEAIVDLRRAEELDPLDPTNPFYLGILHKTLGRPDVAVVHFLKALELDPFQHRMVLEVGPLLASLRRHKEAAAILELLPILVGATPASLRLAARANLEAQNLDRAEVHYARLLEKEPNDFEANVKLAGILLDRHRALPDARQAAAPDLLERAAEHLRRAERARDKEPELDDLRARLEAARR